MITSANCLHAGLATTPDIEEPEPVSGLSADLGITIANQYITRGYMVQDEGTSFQPHLDLVANVYQGDGFITSASAFLGLWAVVSSTPYGEQSNRFTEFDYGPGFTVSFAKRWTFTTFYNRWTSPAGAYDDGHWLSGAIEFDDSGLLHKDFSLKPFLEMTQDLDISGMSGLCLETGIRPSVTFFPGSATPVITTLVIMTGLGNGYYGDDYGYLAIGPQVSVPLEFIHPSAGEWSLTAECLYHDFGSGLAGYNRKSHDVLFSVGVNVGF
ncbi:MAG: hypothetical protein EOP88_05320 [Verrucomicrobiaceae bacterium]|nr:MAG: hypothetical protein EOP88_05320 [Verrucomicrobiaceae bacterium]